MDILNTPATTPPTAASRSATDEQLRLASQQGQVLRCALDTIAGGSPVQLHHAGDYLIALFATEAGGRWGPDDGLRWRPAADDATVHLAVVVTDAVDGRFVPELTVEIEVWRTEQLFAARLPFEWHPVVHHYGMDAHLPNDGPLGVVIRIAPAEFLRHDQLNGERYFVPVVLTLTGVRVVHGRNSNPHATPRGADLPVAGSTDRPAGRPESSGTR